MSDAVLQKIVDIIKADPHGGLSLNLYALVSTLRMEKSGYMYRKEAISILPQAKTPMR